MSAILSYLGLDAFSTPIGSAIKGCTDGTALSAPDWHRNMAVTDMISRSSEGKGVDEAIAALQQRFDQCLDPRDFRTERSIYLTLLLSEACIKNCGVRFATRVPPSMMEHICSIAKLEKSRDVKNSQEAARIIQDLGKEYEYGGGKASTTFANAYLSMKQSGYIFPAININSASVDTHGDAGAHRSSQGGAPATASSASVSQPDASLFSLGGAHEFARGKSMEDRRSDSLSSDISGEGDVGDDMLQPLPLPLPLPFDLARLQRDADKISEVIASALSPIDMPSEALDNHGDDDHNTREADPARSAAAADVSQLIDNLASSVQSMQTSTASIFQDLVDAAVVEVNSGKQPTSMSNAPQQDAPEASSPERPGVAFASSVTLPLVYRARLTSGAKGGGDEARQAWMKKLLPSKESGMPITNVAQFCTLEDDLLLVLEKVAECRCLLQFTKGIESDPALAEVVGFLEVCRDRMQDVLHSGLYGMISDDLLQLSTYVNVAVQRALDAEREGLRTFNL